MAYDHTKISWGNSISSGTSALRLGYDNSTSGQITTVNVYVWTKFAISDTSNTFIVDFCETNGKYNGKVSISTTGNSDAWADSRIVKLWTGTTTNQTWSVNASLTGVEAVGSSNKAWLLTGDNEGKGSGTAWSSIGKPGAISIKQNSDLSITISGTWPKSGTNNPVKYCDLYYKWNSTDVYWQNYSKYVKIESADNGNYSYTIPVADVLNGAYTSIAVRIYAICTYGSNTYTDIKTSTVVQGGIITSVPFRYYFNNSNTGEFAEDSTQNNTVTWDKNYGEIFKLYLEYPNQSRQWYKVYDGTETSFNLSSSSIARAVGLMAMSEGTNWYGSSIQPLSRYYDTRIALDSYNNGKYMGSDYHDIRLEMYLPQVPSSISVTQIDEEDYAYESNKFKISWPVTSRCNQYVIRYAANSPTSANSWTQCIEEVVVNGHDITNTIIEENSVTSKNTCISSLLAGQKIQFGIRGRCSLSSTYTLNNETKTATYTYDSAETSVVELQKQGGMIAYIRDNNENKYQNCHVCVVDNNGKLVKALATYVYTYKNENKKEEGKEWRLIKMNS